MQNSNFPKWKISSIDKEAKEIDSKKLLELMINENSDLLNYLSIIELSDKVNESLHFKDDGKLISNLNFNIIYEHFINFNFL